MLMINEPRTKIYECPLNYSFKFSLKVKWLSCVRLFATPWTVAYHLLCPWDFSGNSTGVDCHFLLQGTFPTQGSNPGLPHRRQMLYHLSHQGSTTMYGKLQKSGLTEIILLI